jgi:hypothetical protein
VVVTQQLFSVNNKILIEEKHIISSCVISNNLVFKNNQLIFSSSAEDLQSFLLSLYHFSEIDYPKFYKMDNLSKLGFLTSEILIKNELIRIKFQPEEIGIVLTTSNSSLDTDIKYFQTTKTIASPALFVYTLPNIVMGEICIRNNFKGENACFVFDVFNAGFLEEYVSTLFNNNILQLCICGWIDVFEENYNAVLFLIATNKQHDVLLFTEENMNRIFKTAETI